MRHKHSLKTLFLWPRALFSVYITDQLYTIKFKKFFFLEPALNYLVLWILLTTLIVLWSTVYTTSSSLIALLWALTLILRGFFQRDNRTQFYLFFEISVLPIFSIILIWGYQRERIFARLRLLLYTFLASLPLLFIIMRATQIRLSSINLICLNRITRHQTNLWAFLSLALAFFVKSPIYFTHMWLPKAHVEAPVYGSIVLAALILKIGTFGLIITLNLGHIRALHLCIWRCGLWATAFVRVMCVKVLDMKVLIAYSSVSHMALLIIMLLLGTQISYLRAAIMILTHGFTSSGLFFVANMIYESSNSRTLLFNKGLLASRAYFFMWALLLTSNIGAPPTINFFAEILSIFSLLTTNKSSWIIVLVFILSTSAYSFIMFRVTSQWNPLKQPLTSPNKKNYLIISRHIVPILSLPLILTAFA